MIKVTNKWLTPSFHLKTPPKFDKALLNETKAAYAKAVYGGGTIQWHLDGLSGAERQGPIDGLSSFTGEIAWQGSKPENSAAGNLVQTQLKAAETGLED